MQVLTNDGRLSFIYFLYCDHRLVYIGRSQHPLKRIRQHYLRQVVGEGNFKAIVYGPYRHWHANVLESHEIIKRVKNKYLLSKTNSNYGYENEKISVKDYGQKTILFFGEGGKIKKVVG